MHAAPQAGARGEHNGLALEAEKRAAPPENRSVRPAMPKNILWKGKAAQGATQGQHIMERFFQKGNVPPPREQPAPACMPSGKKPGRTRRGRQPASGGHMILLSCLPARQAQQIGWAVL